MHWPSDYSIHGQRRANDKQTTAQHDQHDQGQCSSSQKVRRPCGPVAWPGQASTERDTVPTGSGKARVLLDKSQKVSNNVKRRSVDTEEGRPLDYIVGGNSANAYVFGLSTMDSMHKHVHCITSSQSGEPRAVALSPSPSSTHKHPRIPPSCSALEVVLLGPIGPFTNPENRQILHRGS